MTSHPCDPCICPWSLSDAKVSVIKTCSGWNVGWCQIVGRRRQLQLEIRVSVRVHSGGAVRRHQTQGTLLESGRDGDEATACLRRSDLGQRYIFRRRFPRFLHRRVLLSLIHLNFNNMHMRTRTLRPSKAS